MEKQIMIKNKYSDSVFKIKSIIEYLELFVDSLNDKFVFDCCLNANQHKVINEIICLKDLGDVDIIELESDKKCYKFNIIISLNHIVHILDLIEKYDLNVMIYCNDIKMFINDNDGDFIIINSTHKKYDIIKNKSI